MGIQDIRIFKARLLLSCNCFFALLCFVFSLSITTAFAGSLLQNPLFDVKVHLDGGGFSIVEGETSLSAQYIDFANVDRRAALEYDISNIPDGANISLAQITFRIMSFSGGEGDVVEAPMYGFSGDGIASLSDGLETATQIGTLGPIDDLGSFTIDIDHNYVESLLAGSDYLGINILGDPDGNGVSFASLELFNLAPSFLPAQLSLTYNIPGDFDGDDDVDNQDLNIWEMSFGVDDSADADGDGDSDGRDFLKWQQNYTGPLTTFAAAVSVPEPSTATIFLLTSALLATTRRFRRRNQ